MKNYPRTYLNFFGLRIAEDCYCEICGARAVDIHHIFARSIRKDLENSIENLMALCRAHHEEFGDKKQHREMLIEVHQKKMDAHRN